MTVNALLAALSAAAGGFTPVTRTYTGITSGNDVVPTGASQVVITCYGRGGPGGSGTVSAKAAAGGGGGGLCARTIAIAPADYGVNIPYQITGGVGSANCTSIVLTNFSGSLIATNGATGGTGVSSATGGTAGGGVGGTTNTNGTAGANAANTTTGGAGGAGADGSTGGSAGNNTGTVSGQAGADPSGGGGGCPYDVPDGTNGIPGLSSAGKITLAYT